MASGGSIVGSAFIRVRPDVSQFAAELERRIQPQIAQVQRQVDRAFARSSAGGAGFQRAGQVAGEAFSQSFGRSVSGLVVPADLAVQQAGKKVTATAAKVGAEAGKAMGQQAGRKFQEGFEALAAFAIAARVGRFFRETAQIGIEFERAFAGVKRVVPGTVEELGELQESVKGLSEELPFTAIEIANVVQSAAQLGVPKQNLLDFAETVLKVGASTNISAEQAAQGLAKIAAVTGLALTEIEPLASSLVELGNVSGVAESDIVELGQSLAPLAPAFGVPAEEILGLAAGLRRVGGSFEAGATTIRASIQSLRQVARIGGNDLEDLAEKTGLTTNEFRRLAQEDPTQLFVKFLGALNSAGDAQIDILKDLGLGERRFTRELQLLAGGIDKVIENVEASSVAYEENSALTREFSIFAGISANQLQVLQNRIQNTRETLSGALVPVLLAATAGVASLSENTIGLTAAFAGLAAGAFAFQRFGKIFREVSTTLGGGRVSLGLFNAALDRSVATGESVRGVLRGVRQGTLEYTAATEAGRVGTIGLASAEATATTRTITFSAAFRDAQARGLGFAQSVNAATRAVGGLNIAFRALGIAAVVSLIADGIGAMDDALREAAKTSRFGEQDFSRGTRALFDYAEGAKTLEETLAESRIALGDFTPEAKKFGDAVGDAFDRVKLEEFLDPRAGQRLKDFFQDTFDFLPFLGSNLEQSREFFEEFDQAFLGFLQSVGADEAKRVFDDIVAAFEAEGFAKAGENLTRGLDDFQKALSASTTETEGLSFAERIAEESTIRLGEGVHLASGELFTFADAATSARTGLQFFNQVSADFDQRLEAFSSPFGQTLLQESARAARGAGRLDDAARRIADANRDLAKAREDAAERIAEAERKLAEAEEDAIERVIEARRRLEDTRNQGRRRIRDARQELHDFEEALARAGGPQTPEDFIQLRELREAVSDARADQIRDNREAIRGVNEAEEEGQEAVAEAQRRLAEAHEEAAEKIEDAARRIQDAQRKSAGAAAAASENIIDTIGELVASFNTDARLLNQFADLMTTASTRVFGAFQDKDIGEAFLQGLVEMGVEAIPILRGLVKKSDGELKNVEKVFGNRIKQAKRAADFQFDKFPPNFGAKIRNATNAAADEMESLLEVFDAIPNKTEATTAQAEQDLIDFGLQFKALADAGAVHLTDLEQSLLDVGLSSTDSQERVKALKDLVESIKSRTVSLNVNTDKAQDEIEAMLKRIEEKIQSGELTLSFAGGPRPSQHGGFRQAGEPLLVGEGGREFFIPNTDGTVLPNQQTERILAALHKFGGGRGGIVQHFNINEVASDPRATARSVSWAVGQGAIR